MSVWLETRGQFRPSIFIFINDPSNTIARDLGLAIGGQADKKSIAEYFLELMVSLPQELQDGISLLRCEEGDSDISTYEPETLTLIATSPFEQALSEALNKVQSSRLKRIIEANNYVMANVYPQIYLVAQARSTWTTRIAEQLVTALGSERVRMFLAYILVDTPSSVPFVAPLPWVDDLLPRPSEEQPRIDYCLLYEQREGLDHTHVEEADICFAVAEALLALSGTDFSFSPLFQELTQLPIGKGNLAEDRIGSLGTSRIVFPHREIEVYCSNSLGAELMACQLRRLQQAELEEKQLRSEREQIPRQVKELAKLIRSRLADSQPRPYCPKHFWPDLHDLNKEELQQRLQSDTASIFERFDATQQGNLERRQQYANVDFQRWKGTAREAWQEAAEEIRLQIEQKVHELLDKDNHTGFLASLYTTLLYNVTHGNLPDECMQLRIQHKAVYDSEIEHLRMLSQGPWKRGSSLLQAGLTQPGPSTATPSYPLVPAGNAPNTHPPGSPPASTPAAIQVGRDLSNTLLQRSSWLKTQELHWLHMYTASLLVLPPILLLTYDSFNLTWPGSAAKILGLAGGLLGIFLCFCLFLRSLGRRRARRAEEDLLDLYRYHFAYSCEQWEDRQRIILLGTLTSFIVQTQARLESMIDTTRMLKETFEQEAKRVESELFSSASAYRDVLIADNCLLGPGSNSLAVLNDRVRELRLALPREDWHRSNELTYAHMQKLFLEQHKSMLSIRDEKSMRLEVYDFCLKLLQPYIRSDIADFSFVLDPYHPQGELAWKRLLKYATVLYLPNARPHDYLYVGGVQEYHHKLNMLMASPDTYLLTGFSPMWFMALRFWPGGSTSRWTIFPTPSSPGTLPTTIPSVPSW